MVTLRRPIPRQWLNNSGSGLEFSYARPEHSAYRRAVIRAAELLGGQPKLKRLYLELRDSSSDQETFFEAAVRLLRLRIVFDEQRLDLVPRSGPVVFVANHPFGVLDGIALGYFAEKVRPDTRILTHSLLCKVPELSEKLIPIDFGPSAEARKITLRSREESRSWLARGHALAIFAGGSVATCEKPFARLAVDPPWHSFAGALIRHAEATVVPIYFGGQNSRLFQVASHISYSLRLALLFRESSRRIGSEIEAAIGKPIAFSELSDFGDRNDLVRELRRRTVKMASDLARKGGAIPDYRREFHFPKHISFD